MPHKIATVDKYQGQQNDYILLSLVRTYNVGHLRDVRRLVVAMSRARLGLYIFARVSLFKNCFELQPAFNILMRRPLQLHLCPNEVYPGKRAASVAAPNPVIVYDMPMMSKFVADFYKQKVLQLKVIQAKVAAAVPLAGGIPVAGKAGGALRQHPGDGDSDEEEEEGATTSAGKKGGKPQEPLLVEIRNELEMEQVGAVSAENKAAAALERVFVSTEIVEEPEEEEMAVDDRLPDKTRIAIS
jgi:intron-binding protein aquarius